MLGPIMVIAMVGFFVYLGSGVNVDERSSRNIHTYGKII